ncbi:hypothetical protein CAPTEDRAFT_128553, partial [Capitella teleta]
GAFWQITDIHYDSNFSRQPSPNDLCHSYDGYRGPTDPGIPHPMFGDYNCDSPWKLVESAMDAMKRLHPNPDFILWTGDNVPHEPDSDFDLFKVFSSMKTVTERLVRTFEGIPIYPSLGNHDVWPSDQLPVGKKAADFYGGIYEHASWKTMLDGFHLDTFFKGGYYSVDTIFGLRIINVNSVLWYKSNKVSTFPDPADQLIWLEEELQEIRRKGKKVILAGHIPPGSLARVDNMKWFTAKFNSKFNDLLVANSDVLAATIFGHEHTDSFRITRDNNGHPGTPMFLAPAVTPWKSTVPGIGSNNPAIRLYTYNRTSGSILDYQQYFLNLSAANRQEKDQWHTEYIATKDFGVKTLAASDLSELVDKFAQENSSEFDRYYQYNSVSNDVQTKCVDTCKHRHICAIKEVDYDLYDLCMSGPYFSSSSMKVFRRLVSFCLNSLCLPLSLFVLMIFLYVVFMRDDQIPIMMKNNNAQQREKLLIA